MRCQRVGKTKTPFKKKRFKRTQLQRFGWSSADFVNSFLDSGKDDNLLVTRLQNMEGKPKLRTTTPKNYWSCSTAKWDTCGRAL